MIIMTILFRKKLIFILKSLPYKDKDPDLYQDRHNIKLGTKTG
jgi:hypothetical protein